MPCAHFLRVRLSPLGHGLSQGSEQTSTAGPVPWDPPFSKAPGEHRQCGAPPWSVRAAIFLLPIWRWGTSNTPMCHTGTEAKIEKKCPLPVVLLLASAVGDAGFVVKEENRPKVGTLDLLILNSEICGDSRLLKSHAILPNTMTLTTAKYVWQQAPSNTRSKTTKP